ncbi:hypothetical protein INR49_008892 [Caranx melampygus]|nr:hypothetical protein INR49_008892 [Caranx melampygus]
MRRRSSSSWAWLSTCRSSSPRRVSCSAHRRLSCSLSRSWGKYHRACIELARSFHLPLLLGPCSATSSTTLFSSYTASFICLLWSAILLLCSTNRTTSSVWCLVVSPPVEGARLSRGPHLRKHTSRQPIRVGAVGKSRDDTVTWCAQISSGQRAGGNQ